MIIRSKAPLISLWRWNDLDVYSNVYVGNVLNATISLYVYCTINNCKNKISFNTSEPNQSIEIDSKKYLKLNGKQTFLKLYIIELLKIKKTQVLACMYIRCCGHD